MHITTNWNDSKNRRWLSHGSEFVFDPTHWPRDVVDNDFIKLSKLFSAEKSIVRVPDLDPKYKIVILASKQVWSAILLTLFA